jgi:hypothetical protein
MPTPPATTLRRDRIGRPGEVDLIFVIADVLVAAHWCAYLAAATIGRWEGANHIKV